MGSQSIRPRCQDFGWNGVAKGKPDYEEKPCDHPVNHKGEHSWERFSEWQPLTREED